ncbi:transporter [Paenibacillus sp. FSL R7-0273]|uniref:DMT family transporter n=1 Tax=Paenibacillus sp. FSL R7-0273 TaxID=1536772 RepID=UPI0004F706EB|nr:DMT family transporter [Paenibacillus sp. FSL R7-0273]AIQ47353.1 transporter [Paenibacillus sp. FSL R7-0273]OMF96093.1 EamA family transporter [Paenibacillus sp. FSL R7-0273]
MKHLTVKTYAYGAALLYAMIIGLSFMFAKMTVEIAHPLDVLAHRFTLSLIVVSIPILLGLVKIRLSARDIWRILPLGLLSPVLFFAFQTFGLVTSNSSEAGIIQALVPVFTLILASLFLKERTTAAQKLFMLLSVSGVVFIFAMKGGLLSSSSVNIKGSLLLLLSVLSFAGYGVLARPLTRKYKPLELTWVTLMTGCIAFNAAALIRHAYSGTLEAYVQPLGNGTYILALAYLAIASTMLTTLLSSFALTHLEASQMSVFSNLSTLVSIAGGAWILHEPVSGYHIIGALLIIAGVLGTNIKK